MKKPIKKSENKSVEVHGKDEEDGSFPGYPFYPPGEDIMNSEVRKFEIDIENSEHPFIPEENSETTLSTDSSESDFRKGTAADVSEEDLEELGDENLEMDLGDDEDLKHRSFPVDMEGKDLIVPGAELDDENEITGSEDEENNFYSHADN